jgi:hypothetical protein
VRLEMSLRKSAGRGAAVCHMFAMADLARTNVDECFRRLKGGAKSRPRCEPIGLFDKRKGKS